VLMTSTVERVNTGALGAPEPVACATRDGPTPHHLEPGRETSQRRGYWRDARWESRSARPSIAAWSSGSSSGS
jgi:hypothetical protein